MQTSVVRLAHICANHKLQLTGLGKNGRRHPQSSKGLDATGTRGLVLQDWHVCRFELVNFPGEAWISIDGQIEAAGCQPQS